MRTEPSFSAESENRPFDDGVDHQSEISISQEDHVAHEESEHLSIYRQRYGLSIDPFADDQHFPLYTGGQRRQILDQLLHLCQFSHNLLVVLGGYSVGKTRMAQALIDSLDDADDICFLEGQVTSTFETLFSGVLNQFELPDEETFREFVKRQTESDGLAVIIVDNAHHLTDDVLFDLINLMNTEQENRVHVVLFAEPHLLPRLQDIDVRDVMLSDFQLNKFSLSETVDYLNFRMEMADYLGPEVFTESNLDAWWKQSSGQLLELHEYAQDKLLSPPITSSSRNIGYSKKGLPLPHIIGASVLGGALLLGVVYWSGDSSKDALDNKKIASALPTTKTGASAMSEAQSSIDANTAPSSVAEKALQSPELEFHNGIVTTKSVSAASEVNVADNSSASTQTAAAVPVVKQSVVPLVKTNTISKQSVEKQIKTNDVVAAKEVKKIEASPEKLKDVSVEKTNVTAKKIEIQPIEKSKSVSPSGYSEQEKTLLSWSESDFTLQLVGLSTEKAVIDFVSQQPNKKDLLVFKSLRLGKDWFVVVTGRYPSAAKAHQAAQLLPASQKKATPWSRDLKTIQKEIKSR